MFKPQALGADAVRHFQFVDECVAYYANTRPNDVALDFAGHTTSWAQFEAHIQQTVSVLVGEGVKSGARVAFMGRNSDYTLVLLMAVARLGATFLPINWRLSASETQFILKDAEVYLTVATEEWLSLVTPAAGAGEWTGRIMVVANRCRDLALPPALAAGALKAQAEFASRGPAATCVAVQLYTSGTTGLPKGAMLSHTYFTDGARMFLAHPEMALRLDPGERALVTVPMFHVGGLNFCFVLITQGRGLVILDDYDPAEVLSLIDSGCVALMTGVPTMLQALLNQATATAIDFSGLRYFVYGAAPMPPSLVERAMREIGCGFASMYGLTEASGVTYLAPSDHDPSGPPQMLSVGRPLPGVELQVQGLDGRPAPLGAIGEIAIRSPQLLLGYWKQPEATKASFRNGWFLTGDAARLDEAGFVYLQDRIKDMIKSGGENIYPAEVEKVLHRHAAIREVAVVGLADDFWGESPAAFVVLQEGASLTLEELRQFASDHLARFKLPRHLRLVAELPRTASGKVLKRALREMT